MEETKKIPRITPELLNGYSEKERDQKIGTYIDESIDAFKQFGNLGERAENLKPIKKVVDYMKRIRKDHWIPIPGIKTVTKEIKKVIKDKKIPPHNLFVKFDKIEGGGGHRAFLCEYSLDYRGHKAEGKTNWVTFFLILG